MEARGVDAGRDDDTRHRPPRGADARVGRVLPGRDHTGRAPQYPTPERGGAGQPARHRDLGTVRDHDVRSSAQPRADQPEREHRIDEDHVGPYLAGQRVGPARHRARRPQHGALHALDAEGEAGVELRRVRVRCGEHRRLLGRQPLPELRQVRLDPADLGREVVGDEE